MEADINRIIRREFPEIASGYHLPILARIESVSDAPVDGGISDHFRPYFAADITVLDKQRNPVKDLPVYKAIPLPVSFAGLERGQYALPEPGSLCEIAFMYGMGDQLFIRQVFGWAVSIPPVSPGDVLNQAAPDVYEKTDAQGNKTRTTHGNIKDEALRYELDALEAIINVLNKEETVRGNSKETITGTKLIKAMGAIRLLSGGVLNLAAIDNINLTTASDMMTTVAGSNKQTANVFEMLAKTNARIKSEKLWMGSEDENVLGILSETIDLIIQLADLIAAHVHPFPGTAPPPNAALFTALSTGCNAVKARLDGIKE